MIARSLEKQLKNDLNDSKVLVLLGARQVGKSTLVENLIRQTGKKTLRVNGDNITDRRLWTDISTGALRTLLGETEILFIDEAQAISGIGKTAKIIYDEGWPIKTILTGSSAFELQQSTAEALTGRKWTYTLFPISWQEFAAHTSVPEAISSLESMLITGLYPEVLTSPNRQRVLEELASSYLYKDVLALQQVRKPELLERLLQAVALQCGNEVSYAELSRTVGADLRTVEQYLDILQQAFVLYKLPGYSTNERTELKRARKFYFFDNGIRNALINAFQPLDVRTDIGALWENFLLGERGKQLSYHGYRGYRYFWRNTEQREVDYLEYTNGQLHAFEFKWNPAAKARLPLAFSKAYPEATFQVIHRDNFWQWLAEYPY